MRIIGDDTSYSMDAHLALARKFSQYFAGESDARRLIRQTLVCNGLAYLHLLAAGTQIVPAWTLALSIPILVPRWMIALHELLHLRSEREVDFITRLAPFLFTPLSLGYREHLIDHRGHHLHMCTQRDPEYYQLRGSVLWGLLNAFSAPEQMWLRWVAGHGLDRALARDTVLRFAAFVGLMAGRGWAFLWYLIAARLAFGMSYFVFFYALHRRGDEYGVYPLRLPPLLVRVSTFVLGATVIEASIHHDVHHAQPRIAAGKLGACRMEVAGEQCVGSMMREILFQPDARLGLGGEARVDHLDVDDGEMAAAYSSFTPALLMTLAHFSTSARK